MQNTRVKRMRIGCHFITFSLPSVRSREMIYQLVLNCQFSDNVYLQLRSFERIYLPWNTTYKVALFFFCDFVCRGDIKYTKLSIFLFHKCFQSLNSTLSNQGRPFYICQWSRAVSEHFTPADSLFSFAFCGWSGLKFRLKAERRVWETASDI